MFSKFETIITKFKIAYHDLFITTIVLTLADAFHAFCNTCINYYGLNASNLYTSPGLAWYSALKLTEIELELLTDNDMDL